MKICLDCDYTAPAKDSMGAERMIEALARSLRTMGHDVIMRVNPDSTLTPVPSVKEIPKDCDIINFNGWIPGESYKKYNSHGIPWVVTLHGGGTENDPKWLESLNNNPHIICVSKFISDRINCPAHAWSCSAPEDFIFRREKDDYFLWLAGTDWGEGKGLFTTINLAKKMRFKLKIAGTGRNRNIINLIKRYCDDKIEYVGAVNGKDKAHLIAGAKGFFLLTQLPDACPLTVSEALLSGTPIISSANGCMPELIHKDVGFICRTERDIAKAVVNISKIDPQKCYDYGLENFSADATAKKYLRFYQNMIDFGIVHK
jgi:glycosyltransferase involved in cell wall biosynthesis